MDTGALTLVRRRFKAYGAAGDERRNRDAAFQEICADYLETVRALAYWATRSGMVLSEDELLSQVDPNEESARRIAVDYWISLLALEREIRRYLEPNERSPVPYPRAPSDIDLE